MTVCVCGWVVFGGGGGVVTVNVVCDADHHDSIFFRLIAVLSNLRVLGESFHQQSEPNSVLLSLIYLFQISQMIHQYQHLAKKQFF